MKLVQPGPVKNLDVIRVQVETLRQQRAQLPSTAEVFEWMSQLDHPAPFVRVGRALRPGPRRYEVGVILGGHG